MSSDVAIKVSNVSKHYHIYEKPVDRLKQSLYRGRKQFYRVFKALDNVSFEVKKGETVGIIGRNGAGKSTLLQMICGTLTPSNGDIQINGRVAALLELGAGFNPEFTGHENVFMNATLLGLSQQEIDERYDEILEFAGIGDFIDQPVKTYSTGMYVRLAFAIQANVDPEILIVDEALAVGDASFVHKCMTRFRELREEGTTILFVSHDATAVKTLCDSAIWLDKGEIVSSGSSSIVVDQYLSSIMNQPVVIDFSADKTIPSKRVTTEAASLVGEHEIPNIDRRLGDQSCMFVGVGLYDAGMNKTTVLENDAMAWLHVTIMNNSLSEGVPVVIGYSLRNNRGVDIASSNSEIESATITAPAETEEKTIRIGMSLPLLHAGSYSLSLSMGYRNEKAVMHDLDSITNAIVFDITSKKLIHVLLSLKTVFQVEGL